MKYFSSKLFDETIFRQSAQSTKCHFDEVTFRRNGSLDDVSFDEVSHLGENNPSDKMTLKSEQVGE